MLATSHNQQHAKTGVWQLVFAGAGVVVVLVLGLLFLPYSPKDMRRLHAVYLRAELRNWAQQSGDETSILEWVGRGPDEDAYFFKTNMQLHRKDYDFIIALEHPSLLGRGRLLATTNAEVLWMDKDGTLRTID